MILSNKKIKNIIILFALTLFMSGCGIFKKNIKKHRTNEISEVKKIINNNQKKTLTFNTFSASFSGKYSDDTQNLPLKGIIKIKKDNFIWITVRPFLGIEIAKIMLTPDSIKYADKINKRSFAEDYKYLEKKYGIKMNYLSVEKIFTNIPTGYPSQTDIINYQITETDSVYILKYNNKYLHKLTFNKNYMLTENEVSEKNKQITVKINYSDFKVFDDKYFPLKMSFFAKKQNKKSNAEITFKNIKINETLQVKFSVSKHYKKINID